VILVRLHGVPKRIISDRDTRFNSIFFRKFLNALDVDFGYEYSIPPTKLMDRLNEVNRILQEMLRHYVHDHHEQWIKWFTLCRIRH